jgi:uncharacterized membrane protein YgaE (UPF0421/DUF939 family)
VFGTLATATAAYITGVLGFAPTFVAEYHDVFAVLAGLAAGFAAASMTLLHYYPNGVPAPPVQ